MRFNLVPVELASIRLIIALIAVVSVLLELKVVMMYSMVEAFFDFHLRMSVGYDLYSVGSSAVLQAIVFLGRSAR